MDNLWIFQRHASPGTTSRGGTRGFGVLAREATTLARRVERTWRERDAKDGCHGREGQGFGPAMRRSKGFPAVAKEPVSGASVQTILHRMMMGWQRVLRQGMRHLLSMRGHQGGIAQNVAGRAIRTDASLIDQHHARA